MPQIAVKLPTELLASVDDLVASGAFASRSALIRDGIEEIVRAARRRAIDRQYENGYRNQPETAEEQAETTRLSVQSILEEPWERWW